MPIMNANASATNASFSASANTPHIISHSARTLDSMNSNPKDSSARLLLVYHSLIDSI